MSNTIEIPLFPLHTVLFPGSSLPLRIFEPRYLDMVSQSMKSGEGFGVCLIREGSEVGEAASVHEIGTLASISYWQQLPDGLLGLTVRGEQRFQVVESKVLPNQLTVGVVELLPNEERCEIPSHLCHLSHMLQNILEQLGLPYNKPPVDYDDAVWVGNRLSELLPLTLSQKQYFLQLTEPLQRLERLEAMLEHLELQ